jgi:hypothetical protein
MVSAVQCTLVDLVYAWHGVYLQSLSLLSCAVIQPCDSQSSACHLLCSLVFFSSKDHPAAPQSACICLAGISLNFTVTSNGTQDNCLAHLTLSRHDRLFKAVPVTSDNNVTCFFLVNLLSSGQTLYFLFPLASVNQWKLQYPLQILEVGLT